MTNDFSNTVQILYVRTFNKLSEFKYEKIGIRNGYIDNFTSSFVVVVIL